MEDVRSVLDLEAEGIAGPGDFFDSAEYVLLSDEGEGTVLWGGQEGERVA